MSKLSVIGGTEKEPTKIEQAEEIIEFLNKKAGKSYPTRNPKGRPTANADMVICRLNEGYEVADFKAVIARQCREWADNDKMRKYLRPQTLFNRTNFETYIGECSE